MSDTVQTMLVVAAVLGSVIYLVRRQRAKACQKGGCGCTGVARNPVSTGNKETTKIP